MDFLRSCYETDMVLSQGHAPVHVRWYFTNPAAPVIRQHSFGSLSWVRPDYPTDHIGEVVGATRSWVDGSSPSWLKPNPTFSRTGLLSWYVTGAPADFTVTAGVDFAGRRAFPPSPVVPGIFPPLAALSPATHSATSMTRGALASSGGGPYGSWYYHNAFPDLQFIYVAFSNDRLLRCIGGGYMLQYQPGAGLDDALRCLSYDPSTGVSVWDDPQGAGLDAGDRVTIAPL